MLSSSLSTRGLWVLATATFRLGHLIPSLLLRQPFTPPTAFLMAGLLQSFATGKQIISSWSQVTQPTTCRAISSESFLVLRSLLDDLQTGVRHADHLRLSITTGRLAMAWPRIRLRACSCCAACHRPLSSSYYRCLRFPQWTDIPTGSSDDRRASWCSYTRSRDRENRYSPHLWRL